MSAAKKLKPDWRSIVDSDLKGGLRLVSSAESNLGKTHTKQTVLVTDLASPEEILAYSLDKGFSQIVQTDSNYFESDLKSSAVLALQPHAIKDFPISIILDPHNYGLGPEVRLRILNEEFSKAKDKYQLLQKLEVECKKLSKSVGLIADVITVADELLTNAIFNAPFVDLGNTAPGESRENPEVGMGNGNTGTFFVGADAERIVIGCRDPYGSLNASKLFTRIRNCYVRSVAASINMDSKGGAGIGSFMVFNSSTSYFVAVEKQKITVICAVIPIKGSNRTRQESPKNLHYINLEE